MHCNCMFSVPTASSHVDPGLHYSDIWAGCHYSSLGILIWLTIPDSEGLSWAFFPLLHRTIFHSVQSHLACHVIYCDNLKDSVDKSLPRLVEKKIKIQSLSECIPAQNRLMDTSWCVRCQKTIVGVCCCILLHVQNV